MKEEEARRREVEAHMEAARQFQQMKREAKLAEERKKNMVHGTGSDDDISILDLRKKHRRERREYVQHRHNSPKTSRRQSPSPAAAANTGGGTERGRRSSEGNTTDSGGGSDGVVAAAAANGSKIPRSVAQRSKTQGPSTTAGNINNNNYGSLPRRAKSATAPLPERTSGADGAAADAATSAQYTELPSSTRN